jgi:hypothetical protein
LITTVTYGLSLIQGLFSVTPLELAEGGHFQTYRTDIGKLDNEAMERTWKNRVGRSWNTIQQSVLEDAEERQVARTLVTQQLQELDAIFVTHFSKCSRFFMTSSASWTSLMPMYVEALGKYADDMAQQPGGTPWLKKCRTELPDKMRFVMLDHKTLHVAPPLPLMSSSVVGVMVDSLKDVATAIYEVSCNIVLSSPSTFFRGDTV